MKENRRLTCIGCPMGCSVHVELEDGQVKKVEGNRCSIGDKYARNEVTCPERTVTSTVVVLGGSRPRLSVKTKSDIPKEKIKDCMEEINDVRIYAPIKIGDVIISHVAGTKVDVVATQNVVKRM